MMSRRGMIGALAALGGAAAFRPVAARAQETKTPRIGVLIPANPEPWLREFRQGLRDLGYVEGRNIAIELRSADGRPNLLPDLAADLVRLKVDIIVASQTPAATAAKRATAEIPIVMAAAADPVGTGLIQSLARPGGNVTGLSGTTAEVAVKTLELIREMLPSARRVAVLANATDPFTRPFLDQLQSAGRTLNIEVRPVMVHEAEKLEASFAEIDRERPDAVIVQPSLPRAQAAALAVKRRLPVVSPTRAFGEEGGLMSYSASFSDAHRRAAVYIDKILKGARPADLPVEQPTRFELVVNLKTAKALGIEVPRTILERADEVIE
jgi:putative ABC transport system substrate-binding protein